MKKRKTAIMLVFAMLMQTGVSINAQTVPESCEAEAAYVIVGEDKNVVEQVLGTELEEENSFEIGKEEIIVAELTEEEARELQQMDVIIEEDSLFTASTVHTEIEYEKEEKDIEKHLLLDKVMETADETSVTEKIEETTELSQEPVTEKETEKQGETEIAEEQGENTKTETKKETAEDSEENKTEEIETTELTEGEEETDATEEIKTTELEEISATEEIETTEIAEETQETGETEETESAASESTPEKETAKAEEEWNLAAIHAEAYVKDIAPGEKIKIAVLDSGADYRASVPVETHVSVLEGEESNPFFEDVTGHGTAVTSLIVSSLDEESIQGINEDAEVYSVQVLDGNNTGTLSGVVKGIYWAIENDMDIINMSFGTPKSSAILEKAVKDAAEAGILLVAAAGNNPAGEVEYPAAYEEVLAVGSSSLKGEIATESTRGEEVDIYAPGAGIMVNAPFFGMTVESGSSLACAQVSGAASVVWEKDRTKDAEYIRELLKETANKGIDPEYGTGLLDVEEAIRQLTTFVSEEKTERTAEKPLLEFDEGEITALWAKAEHQKMIPADASGYRLMYAAAAFPDEEKLKGGLKFFENNNSNPLNVDRRFHGSKNYFATLNFLVNLAHEYYLKDSGNPNRVYKEARNDPELNCEENWDIVEEVKWYLNNTIFGNVVENETTRHNKAYKLMGAVIHVVGDTYAHRTVVTTEMLKTAKKTGSSDNGYFVKSDFIDWNHFKNEVKTGRTVNGKKKIFEFRHISGYIKKEGEKETRSPSRKYEDNVNIETWRYQDSAEVVKRLVGGSKEYDFRNNTWKQKALKDLDKLSKDI